ncbi:FAD-dependent oxidoreductase [Streptomyces sp. LP05-1]|uniref:FAD-dependent oxidoreductase n=1 Tax=Streptomyces pyxinae TaxID=2970734 RepID=A0ABT2CQE3_9ACTN|nr:FAD-dependent oxidoreductase [Streptomyces sp. LP05-1]MCS0639643.1 FAD-dependent oxidoreductase [Streptomyces sp. LP05-1]
MRDDSDDSEARETHHCGERQTHQAGEAGEGDGSGTDSGFDTLVIGSGGAGLLAACRAADGGRRVLVLERTPLLGGTTAVSGGMVWVPNSSVMREHGMPDSAEDALRYLELVTEGAVERRRLEQYVATAPEVVDYLHAKTPVRLFPIDRPDYHSDWPGARDVGRTLDNVPFPTAGRPGLTDRIRRGAHFDAVTYDERHRWNTPELYDHELVARRKAEGVLTVGAALVAGLVAACDERGVEFATGVRARELLIEDGRVTGVRAETAGGPAVYRAAAGVILASGGYEWDERLKRAFLGVPDTRPVSPPWNHGDGLMMALAAGAAPAGLSQAWWVPAVADPSETYDGHPLFRHLVAERCLPGSVIVNRQGRRFVNEAVNYNDITKAFLAFDPTTHDYPNAPAWLVFDEAFRRRYPIASARPADPAPDWFERAGSPAGLARRLGADEAGLTATLAEFNRHAALGEDPAFGRGTTSHDRYYGDPRHTGGPNPCLGPLSEPPYYAVPVGPGMIGTKGGLVTDAGGRVLRHDDTPVPGLYACGNVAATTMGPGYPGSGGTLGPALVGGYLCGTTVGGSGAVAGVPGAPGGGRSGAV